jgi:transposase
VLSDVFGVSGQLMLEALLKGTSDPAEIAAFAKKKAKQKMPEIMAALQENSMSDHHRLMIRFSVAHLEFLENKSWRSTRRFERKSSIPAMSRSGSFCAV